MYPHNPVYPRGCMKLWFATRMGKMRSDRYAVGRFLRLGLAIMLICSKHDVLGRTSDSSIVVHTACACFASRCQEKCVSNGGLDISSNCRVTLKASVRLAWRNVCTDSSPQLVVSDIEEGCGYICQVRRAYLRD